MTEKTYFKKEYDEEFYIFDSTKISEEKVDMESEYGYEVFSNSMLVNEIVDLLNNQDKKVNELETLAEANEEQTLSIMTFLHDNHYEIWEEINKKCFGDSDG